MTAIIALIAIALVLYAVYCLETLARHARAAHKQRETIIHHLAGINASIRRIERDAE